jgi:hypothetical protein
MFAAAATGYAYSRRGVAARNPNTETPPLDIGVLVRTVKLVLVHLDGSKPEFRLESVQMKVMLFNTRRCRKGSDIDDPSYRLI